MDSKELCRTRSIAQDEGLAKSLADVQADLSDTAGGQNTQVLESETVTKPLTPKVQC